jgi:hypothetical protein
MLLATLLLALVAASPIPNPIPEEGILLARQGTSATVLWRGGTDRRTLMACAGGGPNGSRNGDPVQMCVAATHVRG